MDVLLIIFIGSVATSVGVLIYLHRATKAEKARQKEAFEQGTALYRRFAEDFAKVGWPAWGFVIHTIPEQHSRMGRGIYSKNMELLSYDAESHSACVRGERGAVYHIDEDGCSCPDFRTRRLPCKHMYFAVIAIRDAE